MDKTEKVKYIWGGEFHIFHRTYYLVKLSLVDSQESGMLPQHAVMFMYRSLSIRGRVIFLSNLSCLNSSKYSGGVNIQRILLLILV